MGQREMLVLEAKNQTAALWLPLLALSATDFYALSGSLSTASLQILKQERVSRAFLLSMTRPLWVSRLRGSRLDTEIEERKWNGHLSFDFPEKYFDSIELTHKHAPISKPFSAETLPNLVQLGYQRAAFRPEADWLWPGANTEKILLAQTFDDPVWA